MNQINSTISMKLLDRVGIIVSATCILHCLLTPIAIIALPMILNFGVGGEELHLLFATLAIPIAAFSLGKGYKYHGQKRPIFYAVPGIILLWLAMLVHEPHWLESVLTSIGASLIIISHVLNHRCSKDK